MLRLIIFIVASAGIVYVSRASLRVPRSHGFYRFFAWEFIIVLILLNLERWFSNPFSICQVISWLLLIVSIFLVVHGVQLLRITGRPDEERVEDVPIIGIEKTTTLVTVGAFKYIRHRVAEAISKETKRDIAIQELVSNRQGRGDAKAEARYIRRLASTLFFCPSLYVRARPVPAWRCPPERREHPKVTSWCVQASVRKWSRPCDGSEPFPLPPLGQEHCLDVVLLQSMCIRPF